MRRYARLALATTPLTEAVTPNGEKLSKVDILATPSQYGSFIHISDVVDLTVEDRELNVGAERLSDQMYATLDRLTRNVMAATASSTTCSHGSGTATLLNKTDIDAVVQTMLGNLAQFTTPTIKASTGFATTPIGRAFWAIAHTDLIDDLGTVDGVVKVEQYSNSGQAAENEWCATGNVRWLVTTEGYYSGSNYYCPIIGKEAYGTVKIDGGNMESIIKPWGSGDDPLNQRMTMGWKLWDVTRIINDNYLHNLICTNG